MVLSNRKLSGRRGLQTMIWSDDDLRHRHTRPQGGGGSQLRRSAGASDGPGLACRSCWCCWTRSVSAHSSGSSLQPADRRSLTTWRDEVLVFIHSFCLCCRWKKLHLSVNATPGSGCVPVPALRFFLGWSVGTLGRRTLSFCPRHVVCGPSIMP